MLPAMARRPSVTIVGPGRLGTGLALGLKRAGYVISEVVSRDSAASRRKARTLAKKIGANAASSGNARLQTALIWFCVPDREIDTAAQELASRAQWKGKVAFHSSG